MKLKIFFCLTFFSLAVKQGSGQATVANMVVQPNAFCYFTSIEFDLATNDTVSLLVYDRWGNAIRTFFNNSPLPSGSYSINFLGDSLIDGIYIVALAYGDSQHISEAVTKFTCAATSIQESSLNEKLILFPNPTTDFLNIPLDGMKNILISNLNGQICKNIKTDAQLISVADLPIGFYSVQVFDSTNGLVVTTKLVKGK